MHNVVVEFVFARWSAGNPRWRRSRPFVECAAEDVASGEIHAASEPTGGPQLALAVGVPGATGTCSRAWRWVYCRVVVAAGVRPIAATSALTSAVADVPFRGRTR